MPAIEHETIIGAGLALVTPEGAALFLLRSDKGDHAGEWCFPGGGLENGEDAETAAVRETREETGWIAPDDLAKPSPISVEQAFTTYKQKINNQFLPMLNDEHIGFAWASLDNPPHPLHPGVAAILDQVGKDQAVLTTNANGGIPLAAKEADNGGPEELEQYLATKPVHDEWAEDDWAAELDDIEIDLTHDVEYMSVLSRDGSIFYGDESLPEEITNNGKPLNPIDPLLVHEHAEFNWMQTMLGGFKKEHGREPNDEERKRIYVDSHTKAGLKAEGDWIEANGYDWNEWEAWCRGKLSELENKEIKNPPPDQDVKPMPHNREQPEFTGDKALAFDREVTEIRRTRLRIDCLALDRGSVRTFTKDGRLDVDFAHISKANICPYYGHEIPNYESLGLDPRKIYQLLRDPEELAKGAHTFEGLPLLDEHQPVTATVYDKERWIGTTGTEARFEFPYLDNRLIIWTQEGIDGVDSGEAREISCGYHYVAIMEPGVYQGEPYDGRMTNIVGNHVALVREGRAGADIVVPDHEINHNLWRALAKAILALTA